MGLFGKKIEAKDIEGFLLRALKESVLFGDISYERAPNPYTVLIINKEDIHGLLADHIGEKGRVRFDYIDTKEMLVLELVAELPKEKEQQRRHAWWGPRKRSRIITSSCLKGRATWMAMKHPCP